jgi:hypothetical protein
MEHVLLNFLKNFKKLQENSPISFFFTGASYRRYIYFGKISGCKSFHERRLPAGLVPDHEDLLHDSSWYLEGWPEMGMRRRERKNRRRRKERGEEESRRGGEEERGL